MRLKILKLIFLIGGVFLCNNTLLAQDSLTISGRVFYNNNQAIQDVSVSVENQDISPVFTDAEGYFSIRVPDSNSSLLISPVQTYKAKRIFIGNQRELSIYLARIEQESGHDVLNTHLGTVEKRNVISSVDYKDFSDHSNYGFASIEQYMNGSITGFYNINQTSTPGSGSFSSLRGLNSIYASNQPLYIIDGVIMESPGIYSNLISGFSYNPVASIKPEDVSSITVLKDASATAFYGMKGANGVVIIETLKTVESKTRISITAHSGISMKPLSTPVLDADQYRSFAHELLQSVNFPEENIQKSYPGLLIDESSADIYDYRHDTKWQENTFKSGNMYNAYLSILGGDAVAKYGISFSMDRYNGIVDNSNFDRLGIRMVGNVNVLPRVRLYMNAYLNTADENQVEDMTEQQVSPQYVAMVKSPILGPYIYDKLGNPTNQLMDPLEFNISNPLAVSEGYIGQVNNTRILGSFRLEGDITDRLMLKSLLSINKSDMTEKVYFPNIGIAPYENGEINNISKRSHNNLTAFYNNTYLEYTASNIGAHDLYLTGGFRLSSTKLRIDQRIAKNLPENDAVNNLGEGEDSKRDVDGDSPGWTWLSYYFSGRYSYKDKYLIDAVINMDASSTVGKEAEDMVYLGAQPFGLFYSAGAAWRLSNEDFLRDVSALEEMKIRASYSISGNDDIGPYSAQDYYKQVLYRGVTGIIPGRTTNLALKNETIEMINIGVDVSLFGEKLNLTGNIFQNTTDDLFLQTQTEGWIWDEILARNSGSSSTRGFELEAGTFIKIGRKLLISSSFNITKLESRIKEIYKDQVIIPIEGGQLLYQSGSSFPQFYGYVFEGVYSTDEETGVMVNDENIPYRAGDAKFSDIGGPGGGPDGKISDYDKTSLGSPVPEFYGGWMNRITFGRWVLDINFQFVGGNKVYNYRRFLSEGMSDFANQSLHVEQRWRQEGDITNTPRALLGDDIGNSSFSSRWIEDGSFLRLKSAALRYVIPEKFIAFQNAEFYLSGNNLFTLTNYLGDPEVGRGYRNYQQGIDYGLLPNVRSIILGVKLGL